MNSECLYNVFDHTGAVAFRMTGREAERRYGSGVWDYFGEGIDHSEWCDRRECIAARDAAAAAWGMPVMRDPFYEGAV